MRPNAAATTAVEAGTPGETVELRVMKRGQIVKYVREGEGVIVNFLRGRR